MWNLIQRLLRFRDREITIVILDNQEPEVTDSFKTGPRQLLRYGGVLLAVSVLITTLIFYLTPLGAFYVQSGDSELRDEMFGIAEQVIALEDSLARRDRQLVDMKQILVQIPDTLFPEMPETEALQEPEHQEPEQRDEAGRSVESAVEVPRLTREALEALNRDLTVPVFPASKPVDGSISQMFDRDESHYGLDLAASAGTEIHAVADGTVLFADWTTPYGYVLYLQHRNGYLTVYKHASRLFREVGETVVRGEVLGTVGDRGALSYGAHLHFELWHDGVVQNPQNYLTYGE
ncbi:MAG: M23 family metallopeptidase [Bacteroidota bacterium]